MRGGYPIPTIVKNNNKQSAEFTGFYTLNKLANC